MEHLTASSIISYVQDLEDRSAAFYSELPERFEGHRETFLKFGAESKKNKVAVVRTYQETITDALEACFSFEGLDLASYTVDTTLPEDVNLGKALQVALALEDAAVRFYIEVAERSQALLATIPRAFRRVARKRSKRKEQLEALL